LIIDLSASYGAVSAVLMTERGTVQMLVYFISRALQGPELNYTTMEKLVLSLVFAAKRLRRAATKVERRARRTQYNVSPKDIGERTASLIAVSLPILADFLIEKPDENPLVTPVVETPLEPWTLFTDGSSCVDGSKYEALIAGLRIAVQMGVRNV
ncbi:reverse transcriptase domain-containing protein, partial [Tanacetum coccineum]